MLLRLHPSCGARTLASFALDPIGTWLTDEGKATVRMTDCGGALCATIVSLKEPNDPASGKPKTDINNVDAGKRNRPIIGMQILMGLRPQGNNKWLGQISITRRTERPMTPMSFWRTEMFSRCRVAFFSSVRRGPGRARVRLIPFESRTGTCRRMCAGSPSRKCATTRDCSWRDLRGIGSGNWR